MAKYRTAQAARLLNVATITLKRWLLSGKVDEVQRDRNGWRVFTGQDIVRLKEYASTLLPPENPRSPTLFTKGKPV